ncbi:MAG: REP-associated tyrosine transposase [Luteimonas sp.]
MQRQHPHSHRLRLGPVSQPGGVYLVTFTTFKRTRCFLEFDAACAASRVLAAPTSWPHARLLAWVLMPDHWHGLIELGGHESLSRSVARAKAAARRHWRMACGADAPLWAPGFHDHALRKAESIQHCARYIVRNPVRAGLVTRCAEYPFWDAIWLD